MFTKHEAIAVQFHESLSEREMIIVAMVNSISGANRPGLALRKAQGWGLVPWIKSVPGWPCLEQSSASLLLLALWGRGNPPVWVYGFWGQTHFMLGAGTKAWKETSRWEDTVLIQTIQPPRWFGILSFLNYFLSSYFSLFCPSPSLYPLSFSLPSICFQIKNPKDPPQQ